MADRTVGVLETDLYGPVFSGQRLVYTAGTFDLLHPGHIRFLEQCRKIAGPDGLVGVGVNSDEFVLQYRRTSAIMTAEERLEMVAALATVSSVQTHGCEQEAYLLTGLVLNQPRYPIDLRRFLVIGADWAKKDYYSQIGVNQDWLDKHRVTLCYVPYTRGISSQSIRNRIKTEGL